MSAKRDELLYGLGVRYLRQGRWNDARQALSQVRTRGRAVFEYHRYYDSLSDEKPKRAKEDRPNPSTGGVLQEWIEQDLRTVDDLERLEREVETAEGDDAKAEPLYQLGSYQYRDNLLFYMKIDHPRGAVTIPLYSDPVTC